MAKKKIPSIVKEVRLYPQRETNYAVEKTISFSQLSMYSSCPRKWALQYKEGHYTSESSIHMTFGTALHEALQHYLTVMYEESGAAADRVDIESYFEERLRETYLKDYKSNKNIHFSNSEEIAEFYEDGIEILKYLKKKKNRYFSKKGWYLIGCEVPITIHPHYEYKNLIYKGYLDVVFYNETTNKIKILDIKTSTRGWDEKTKKDEVKQTQLILYKKYFSKQFNFPEENIDVEFFIVKRKVRENSDFPISRIQAYTPPSGKIKLNKASQLVENFITSVFNPDNSYKEKTFEPNPSKWNCNYCPFNNNKELCNKGIL